MKKTKVDKRRSVFVVHGRDDALRDQMFEFLRALDLRPTEWEEAVGLCTGSLPVLGAVVAAAISAAQATLVVLSPDDVVSLHPDLCARGRFDAEARPQMQSRPNVLIELGMALAVDPDRTIIVRVGGTRPITDLGGLNYVQLDESPASLRKIASRLERAGCDINSEGTDWLDTRRFAGLAAYGRLTSAA